MATKTHRIEALRAIQPGGTLRAWQASAAAPPELSGNLFRRGEYWTVSYEGSVVHLKDAKGMRHLARPLAHPGREFHAVDLETADSQPAQAAPARPRGRADGGELKAGRISVMRVSCSTPRSRPPTRPGSTSFGLR